jgi:hypothetical protein
MPRQTNDSSIFNETVRTMHDGALQGQQLVSEFQTVAELRRTANDLHDTATAQRKYIDSFLNNPITGELMYADASEIPEEVAAGLAALTLEERLTARAASEAARVRGDSETKLTEKVMHEWLGKKVRVEAVKEGTHPITIVKYGDDGLVNGGQLDTVESKIWVNLSGEDRLTLRNNHRFMRQDISHYAARILDKEGEPLVRVRFL